MVTYRDMILKQNIHTNTHTATEILNYSKKNRPTETEFRETIIEHNFRKSNLAVHNTENNTKIYKICKD